MESDEEGRRRFATDKKIRSKKRKQEDKDDEDNLVSHDLLRLCVAEGLTDEEILARIKQLRGL